MRKAFCLASGPSLTPADVELVREWRGTDDDHDVIVANTTFRAAPWADALYAMDRRWWIVHSKELRGFKGRMFSPYPISESGIDVTHLQNFKHFSNTGAGAIALAMERGARVVYLLGYDGKRDARGRSHWHTDHPKPLSNALSILRWGNFFNQVARYARHRGVVLMNCSRETSYTLFTRVDLEVICRPTPLQTELVVHHPPESGVAPRAVVT